MRTLYKADTSLKRDTSSRNEWCPLYRDSTVEKFVVIQFQCFRGWDTPFFSFKNECDEGNIALEVD